MKVCMITSYPPFHSGIALYSEQLIKHLIKHTNFEPYVFFWNYNGFINRTFQPILNFFKLRRAFLESDIVHVQYHFAEYMFLFLPLMLLMPNKAKLILTLHEDNMNRLFIIRWFHYLFYHVADLLLVHTNNHKSLLYTNKSRCKTITFGVRSAKTISNRENYILIPGFINPRKGVSTLIKAWSMIESKFPNYKLIIAGKAHNKKCYESLLKQSFEHNIEWREGFLSPDEFHKLIMKAKLVILPYERITMSAVLSDVIGHGTPCILSNIPAFKEYVPHGVFFEPKDHKELSARIEELLSNSILRSEQSLYLLSLSIKYSWNNAAREHIDKYVSILEK
jgi:glycosyltransferase involved in cell wall biosynthesis